MQFFLDRMMKLEESSGTEEEDARLLEEACVLERHEEPRYNTMSKICGHV